MSPPTKPTAFWGPQKRYMNYTDWPWPYQIHLQLHDMLPGTYWNGPDGILLQNKRILLPTGSAGNFRLPDPPWFFQYRHRLDKIWIIVQWYTIVHTTFKIQIHHLRQQFAYNEILDPAGVFAYGGYASLAWEAT